MKAKRPPQPLTQAQVRRTRTAAEIADFAKVARGTVYRWCDENGFPQAVMWQGVARWRMDEVCAWLSEHFDYEARP